MRIEPGQNFEAGRAAEKQSLTSPREPAKSAQGLPSFFRNPLEALEELARKDAPDSAEQGPEPRWPAEKMPLGVWLDPHTGITPEATLAVMRQWEAASGGRVRFELRLAEPDIRIQWSDEPVPGRDFEVGHTDVDAAKQRIRQVTVTLVKNPAIDARLDETARRARLQATILHETGHALGLRHSENDADVMHHRGWQRAALSPNDIRRIQALYPEKGQLFQA